MNSAGLFQFVAIAIQSHMSQSASIMLVVSHRIHVWYIYIVYNIGGILMVNVTIYTIHGSYGIYVYRIS